jgi:hypothetical protein
VSTIEGNGVVAPGDPVILTASQVDPSGGLSFSFQFSGTGSPIYGNASASGNDVLHLTGTAPFTMQLTSSNAITVDFSLATLAIGQEYLGGFYTDNPNTTDATVFSGTPDVNFVGTDGYHIQYDGFVSDTANFGSGPVQGKVMEFTVVVPEPSTYALLAAAAAAGLLISGSRGTSGMWRCRKRMK